MFNSLKSTAFLEGFKVKSGSLVYANNSISTLPTFARRRQTALEYRVAVGRAGGLRAGPAGRGEVAGRATAHGLVLEALQRAEANS